MAVAAEPVKLSIEAEIRGQRVEAQVVRFSSSELVLLGRDGVLWDLRPDEVKNYRQVSSPFRSFSASELRDQLQRELGSRYEVTGAGNYLVAHPAGQGTRWSQRFEELYRSMLVYMNKRGVSVRPPDHPLVAIVFASRAEFQAYSVRDGLPSFGGMLGYYSLRTNRIAIYDIGDGKGTASDWRQNAATIVHEAAHQTAFNTGVHSRLAPPPRWLAEGLGMLFEARGVWDSQNYPLPEERLNRERLADFRRYLPRRKPGSVLEMIDSDRPFGSRTLDAYAEAWAFSFFLIETQPVEYARYLSKTAARSPQAAYGPAQRLADFTAVFGSDTRMIEARFLRFVEGLK